MAPRRSTTRPSDEDGFAAALGQALETRGVSLVALQRRLAERGHRVSAGTLSYWRSGQRQPEKPASLHAVTEIEDLLDLDPGALHSRIGPSRRPGPPLPQVADGGAAPADVPLRELGLGEVDRQLQDLDPAALPTHCVQSVQPLDEPAVETPVNLGGLDTVHVSARSFGPGHVGLAWEW